MIPLILFVNLIEKRSNLNVKYSKDKSILKRMHNVFEERLMTDKLMSEKMFELSLLNDIHCTCISTNCKIPCYEQTLKTGRG